MGKQYNWLGWAVTGKEFVAMDDMDRHGIDYWRGVRVEFERRGKQRTAEPHEYPALHNYIWIRLQSDQAHLLSKVRFLGSTFHILNKEALRQFQRFSEIVDAKREEARRIEGNRKAIADYAAYQPGDALEIIGGPLAGEMATFARMIQTAHNLFPTIKAEMELMGRTVPMELDPLDVKRVASG